MINSLSFWSCFFVPMLVDDKILLRLSFLFCLFLSQRKILNFCRWFIWKDPWTDPKYEMDSFFKQPDSQATQWQNKFVTGIKVFTQNDLTVCVVLIWYLPIVNLLSFLSVLTHWGYFFVNYSSSLTLFWMILMLCIWLHRISFRRSKVLKTCSRTFRQSWSP